ncbi:zinc-ribbon domain-containing protein [Pseudoflavonifractor capillosus]|uniref:Zinc-ribbon domain-containing protein n=1 Tax=Pseudoflavonifractor capillosus TaxID=106588 RepID=A0A921MPE1_9FIRM|nr:zinc-ribbon domain-containing protein [Pseudoflavonifractor capillosus]
MFCPNCGFPYGPDDRFCGRCGAALPAREDASPASPSPEPSPPRLAQSGGCPGL